MKLIQGNFNGSSPKKESDIPETPYQVFLGRFATTDLISSTIIKLLLPHLDAKKTEEELEHLFEVAITCWNIAVISELNLPNHQQAIKQTLKDADFSKKEKELAKIFTEQKKKLLPGLFTFIGSFEMDENEKGHVHFSVEVSPFDNLINEDHADEDPGAEQTYRQFEEGYTDRMALLIRPKQPFWNWLNETISRENNHDDADDHTTVYLIHEEHEETGVDKWLKKNFDKIFMEELYGWVTDPGLWPQKRTYKMFTDFFHITEHSMVFDLEKSPIFKV